MRLGVTPPWYDEDHVPFNLYAMDAERDRDIRRAARHVRHLLDNQEEVNLAPLLSAYDLDTLTPEEIERLEEYINADELY